MNHAYKFDEYPDKVTPWWMKILRFFCILPLNIWFLLTRRLDKSMRGIDGQRGPPGPVGMCGSQGESGYSVLVRRIQHGDKDELLDALRKALIPEKARIQFEGGRAAPGVKATKPKRVRSRKKKAHVPDRPDPS